MSSSAARILETRGAAEVLLERDCDGKTLYETTEALLADPDRRGKMRQALLSMAVVDSAERIYQIILELARAR